MKSKHDLENPVYSDKRGKILRIKLGGMKFNILYTKKGALRSGDYHNSTQHDLILKGMLEIWLSKNGKTVKLKKKPNELIVIPPNTPHLFKFLSDSIMIEWWNKPFECKYYEPFRRLVEKQFKKKEP